MQKLFNALGRMGTMFVSKASQMPETTPPQRKLALEAIGLHFQNYPHYYSEYLAYRKMIWEKTKTGAITLRDIGEILKNGNFYIFFSFLTKLLEWRDSTYNLIIFLLMKVSLQLHFLVLVR
jgi:hypothetical protein